MSYRKQILCIGLFFVILIMMGVYTTYLSIQKITYSNVEKPLAVTGQGEYLKIQFLGLAYAVPKEELTYSSLKERSAAMTSQAVRNTENLYQKACQASQKGWLLLREKLDRLWSRASG